MENISDSPILPNDKKLFYYKLVITIPELHWVKLNDTLGYKDNMPTEQSKQKN